MMETIAALKIAMLPAPVVQWGDAAAHLRLSGETERTLVESYIATATQHLDGPKGILKNVAIGMQTWDDTISTHFRTAGRLKYRCRRSSTCRASPISTAPA